MFLYASVRMGVCQPKGLADQPIAQFSVVFSIFVIEPLESNNFTLRGRTKAFQKQSNIICVTAY